MRLGSHSHAYACFHYVVRGVYAESTRSVSRIVPARNALLKPPRLPHWNHFEQEACSLRIEFPVSVLAGCAARLPDELVVIEGAQIAWTCVEVLAELERNDDCSALAIEGLCVELLARSLRMACLRPRRLTGPPGYVVRCEDYLREHFRDSLKFAVIAEQLGMSRTHLATAFRAHHACTMGDFVRRLRVERPVFVESSRSVSASAHSRAS